MENLGRWVVSFYAVDGRLFSILVACAEHKAIVAAEKHMSAAQKRIKAAECIGIKVEAF